MLLPTIYKEVSRIDRAKPVNLRLVIDERNPHPFTVHGRLLGFARRNGVQLRYAYNYYDKRSHRVVLSVGDRRGNHHGIS